jgi:hypothetical protein
VGRAIGLADVRLELDDATDTRRRPGPDEPDAEEPLGGLERRPAEGVAQVAQTDVWKIRSEAGMKKPNTL